ncbi:MAG: hypothetical protein PWR04_1125, partial [Anaerophaga sp.]|nr:hypothetical protein [Anaerophaga sp.]
CEFHQTNDLDKFYTNEYLIQLAEKLH